MTDFSFSDIPNPNQKELEVLKKHFGFNNFRSGQWHIIYSLLHQKRDVCGILATGQGKSLCYQFPAIVSNKCSVVISPLISLMQDQKMSLVSKGISCEVLCGTTKNYLKTMTNVIEGQYKVVYTTPEFINSHFSFLDSMFKNDCLCLIAIDEAHCISQWGHDFRPSYRQLHDLRKNVPQVPILALTATATPTIQKDICDNLNLKNAQIIRAPVHRPNLSIHVKHKSSGDILSSFKEILGPPKSISSSQSFIVYTNSRKDCENVYNILKRANYPVDFYHAGMTDIRRKEVHEAFIYDRIPIVVATIAFGMGIDKPSIRKIINWGIPANLETYYQEIGRAGRDGLDSDCYLLYNNGDLFIHKFLIDKMQASNAVKEHHSHLLNIIKQWADSSVCRQYQISSYFENEQLMNEMPIDDNERCKRCDNCISYDNDIKNNGGPTTIEKVNIGPDAKLLINLINSLSINYGFTNLIGILTGTNSKTFPAKLKLSSYYTKGDHHSQSYWKAICDIMIDLGYLKYTKVGGLFTKKTKNGHVFQVVAIGSKKLDSNGELWITPTTNLSKFITPTKTTSSSNEDLHNKLKEFRTKCSEQLNLPPYLTLPDSVINKLLHVKLPTNVNKLSLVDGMNSQVILTLGNELVDIMNSFKPPSPVISRSINKITNMSTSSGKKYFKSSIKYDEDNDDLEILKNTISNKRSLAFLEEEEEYNEQFDNYIKNKNKQKNSSLTFKKPTILKTTSDFIESDDDDDISPKKTNFIESDDENIPYTKNPPINNRLEFDTDSNSFSHNDDLPPFITDDMINDIIDHDQPKETKEIKEKEKEKEIKLIKKIEFKKKENKKEIKTSDSTEPKEINGSDQLNDSQRQTLECFLKNMTIDQIANQRNLVTATIENHLMKIFEVCNTIDYTSILSNDQFDIINKYLNEHQEDFDKLKLIKDGLSEKGNNFSYLQIKIAKGIRSRKN